MELDANLLDFIGSCTCFRGLTSSCYLLFSHYHFPSHNSGTLALIYYAIIIKLPLLNTTTLSSLHQLALALKDLPIPHLAFARVRFCFGKNWGEWSEIELLRDGEGDVR